jgi:autotransporter-associated beta strand protein
MAGKWKDAITALYPSSTIAVNNAIPASSPVNIAAGATLDVNSTTTAIGPLGGDGNIALGAAGRLTINQTSPGTLNGSISGGGAIIKSGASSLALAGANTYSGDTTVSNGTLTLGNAPDPLNANPGNDASTVTIASTGATLNLSFTGTDKVDKLVIGTTRMAAGVYGPSGIQLPQITGSGTLTVASGPGYASWITGDFAHGRVPADKQGANDDPDNDGIVNLVEYALAGEDPMVAHSAIGTFTGTHLAFDKRPSATGIAYAIEESEDLGMIDNWTEVAAYHTNNASRISFDLPSGRARTFVRLVITSY